MSYLSFAVPPLEDHLQPYRPETDLNQLGEGFEVVPVPFTVSPVGLLERLRSEIGKRATWEGVKFNETLWQEKLVSQSIITLSCAEPQLAMYPIMFPIYIAEFEHKTEARTWKYQVVMDAHDEKVSLSCRISSRSC